jgi:hypothetical protein
MLNSRLLSSRAELLLGVLKPPLSLLADVQKNERINAEHEIRAGFGAKKGVRAKNMLRGFETA